jgi:hypothetical protein
MKNLTGRKGLNCVEDDPRVVCVWDEGPDGYWLELADGWKYQDCSCIHEPTVRDVLVCLSLVSRVAP